MLSHTPAAAHLNVITLLTIQNFILRRVDSSAYKSDRIMTVARIKGAKVRVVQTNYTEQESYCITWGRSTNRAY